MCTHREIGRTSNAVGHIRSVTSLAFHLSSFFFCVCLESLFYDFDAMIFVKAEVFIIAS